MAADLRSWGAGVLALGLVAAADTSVSDAFAGARQVLITVEPAPGSTLDVDDARVTLVRTSLSGLLAGDPSSDAGDVEDQLEDDFASVADTVYPPDYVWYLVNGHWIHRIEQVTEFVVGFGGRRTVLVRVTETENKPL